MNPIEYDLKRQRNIELLVNIICTFYAFGFSALITYNHWESWDLVLVVVFTVLAWLFFLISYKDYRFRASLTFGMMQLLVVLYILKVDNITESLSTVVAIMFVILLYSIPELIFMSLAVYTFGLAYHIFFTGQIHFNGNWGDCRLIMQILGIYLAQFVIYYVLRRQSEINLSVDERIEELKEAERSKDDFLANVSHEIRTPINTICGMSETVLRDENIPVNLRDDIFSIQTAGQNLLSVVSDILDFSELQAENVELVEDAYSIGTLAGDIINMSVAKCGSKKIEIVVDLQADIPTGLVGDDQKIRRVMFNLISNAIKFTNEGCVLIKVGCRKEEYGINLMVSVRDTGIGMNRDQMEKIFTMFSQVDSKRNRQEGGIGLGLAISKAIVTQMGGFITVQSEPDKGTDIRFTVPQKVANWEPVAKVENAAMLNVAIYINMEQFGLIATRDTYVETIDNMISQLQVSCHVCQSLPEMKRRAQREYLTHVIISVSEYQEDKAFFDILAEQAQVLVLLDREHEALLTNDNLVRIYKPLCVLSVVMALNGKGKKKVGAADLHHYQREAFTAPTARILAVDDNKMNLKVLENLLKPYKVQLVTVTSGPEALEFIGTRNYDLVFMDHMMPEMDGIETLKRIRSKPGQYYKRVPVVALTANAVSGMREMFLSEGFDGFVAKPIEMSVLDRTLRRFIPEYKIVTDDGEKHDDPDTAEAQHSWAEEAKAPSGEPEAVSADDVEPTGEGVRLNLGDLDIEKGLMYCGDEEGYIDVLRLHYRDGEKNREKIEDCYAAHDWKNYQIYVHALKSSMMSIGAVNLSEMAKKLEAASKEGDEEYILAAHAVTMEEYERVLGILANCRAVSEGISQDELEETFGSTDGQKKAETEADKNPGGSQAEPLEEMPMEDFVELAAKFEDAAFSIDGDAMRSLLDGAKDKQCMGHPLGEAFEPIFRKIDMEDYMSAADAMTKMRDKWQREQD
ncbi:MAG: ATP-binding protein [Clostridiales bacterium]|nr:ATP-binding protein [Clostridiales bacterium]